jgi:hypothetical protein
MKLVIATGAGVAATLAFSVGTATGGRVPQNPLRAGSPAPAPIVAAAYPTPPRTSRPRPAGHPSYAAPGSRGIPTSELSLVIRRYCGSCHSPTQRKGNLSLQGFNVDSAFSDVSMSEKVIRKLRAEMMPPPGSRRPEGDTLLALVETLEQVIDRSAKPNPGTRPFQRLNRPEYEHAIRDLLGVEINAGDYLPLDTKSANFDNIADVQALSTTMVDAYLNAAAAVSRIAVGDRKAAPMVKQYVTSPFISQHPWDHADGAPYGTRGGIVAMHTFPADGMYEFRMDVEGGIGTRLEDIDVSVDGQRVTLLHYERGINPTNAFADKPLGVDVYKTEPIALKAGQKRVSVAFVRHAEGPYEDLIRPHDWSKASNGTASAGTTEPPAIMDVAVIGPQKTTGISETPSRRIIFSCRPAKPAQERPCAEQIITRLGTKAYRRPLTAHDRESLLGFYDKGAAQGGFDDGVRLALQAMIASPHFVFRIEPAPPNVAAGADYQISDVDLASRLSFFLWGSIPDDRLLGLAIQGKLSQRATLEREVRRMLADSKAEALASRFAAQWLRLQDLDKVRPDAYYFPDYTQQLADDMRRETELFFYDFVRNDRSVLDLFTANYTYVNDRLARHYGIANVSGPEFRRVTYPDATRRGLLGHGSILVQTSLANRTSPVLRGKWVMEVLLGMPPPPPPPGVPDLEETKDAKDGRPLTTRERMEIHRANPTCKACHQYMDPIGLALDNFDVTGKWRYRENSAPLDTRGTMYDGTPVSSPADLTTSLVNRPIPLVRAFTENLMAYGLGRRVEDYDQPTVRAIVRSTAATHYKMSSFILGVVTSPAFRSKRSDSVVSAVDKEQR